MSSSFFCTSCGYETVKWQGKCPSCQEWNSIKEAKFLKDKKGVNKNNLSEADAPEKISEIQPLQTPRVSLASQELNRVLGGGLVLGSVILISGEPGIGKSTLFLQLALRQNNSTVLYVSGEESSEQIKLRSERLKKTNEGVYIYNGTHTSDIIQAAVDTKPLYIIIDSVQTIKSSNSSSSVGSISRIRESTAELMEWAKQNNVSLFLIGHINKEGNLAGPKHLEHMVDVVLHFDGEPHNDYRLIRSTKNRFGPTSEIGVFQMQEKGLTQITNISELLISKNEGQNSGSATASIIEGNQALMMEVQSLVTQSSYGQPQRTITGYDHKRLQLLLAVLEKRFGFAFYQRDVFVSLAGNIRVTDPAIELAICASLISSYTDKYVPSEYCFSGEVALSGEIRHSTKTETRLKEAERLGFKKFFMSVVSSAKSGSSLKLQNVDALNDVISLFDV